MRTSFYLLYSETFSTLDLGVLFSVRHNKNNNLSIEDCKCSTVNEVGLLPSFKKKISNFKD